jgi:nitronate monooxygenase
VRAALAAPGTTTITRAFTGRRARGLANRWTDLVQAQAPSAYPDLMHVTAPLRAEGVRLGDRNAFNVWAGERHDEARPVSAARVVETLAAKL